MLRLWRVFSVLALVAMAADGIGESELLTCVAAGKDADTDADNQRVVPEVGVHVRQAGELALQIVDEATGAVLLSAERGWYTRGELRAEAGGLSPISVLKDAADRVYRAYFADGFGTVWRMDIPHKASETGVPHYTLRPIAHLGDGGEFVVATAPELIRSVDSEGRFFDGVLLTALRRMPDESRQSAVFYLRDFYLRDFTNESSGERMPLVRATDLRDMATCGATHGCPHDRTAGWYLTLPERDERIAGRVVIWGGRVFAVTYLQDTVDCEAGTAQTRLRSLDLATGTPIDVLQQYSPGRQIPREVSVTEGRLSWPGDTSELAHLIAAPTGAYQLYWRDLLIDQK
jgi:hypothetical protein